jgi:hypothetical protein
MRYAIALILAFAASAAQAQVSCQVIGQQTYCSNGQSATSIGNNTYYSNGGSSTTLGNTTYFNPPIYQAPQVYMPTPIQPYQPRRSW